MNTPQDAETHDLDQLILTNRKLEALALLRQERECGLDEALRLLASRYRELRVASPSRFSRDHEQYWRDFYS